MAIIQTSAYDEFIEFITSSPTLEETVNFRLSDATQTHFSQLLEKNRNQTLTAEEQAELNEFLHLEHLMRMMKIRAYEKMDAS